ncbi:MAG: Gfo/Idh/MocA family oxidoreductase [Clostridia bacterium]|nr:Gfo/Idh/MocA family oxidoreductase [Clostridia bacterium]
MSKMKYGIIGCGVIAKRFSTALAKSATSELYACAARDKDRAEAFAKGNGAKVAYGSYEELIADPEVDAIYIATIHNKHAKIAEMCINGGKPVICEKPFFVSGEEADRVITLAKEKNVLIMEAFWTRMQPSYLKIKEWIKDGKIGDITMIYAAFAFCVPYNEQTKNSRLFLPETAGGALLDVGVYPYEYITGIMEGEPEEFLYCVDRFRTGVDGSVAMIMKYPGCIATGLTSITATLDTNAEICGNNGRIKHYYFPGGKKAELFNQQGEIVETFTDDEDEGFVYEVEHFTELIRSGKKDSDMIPLKDVRAFAYQVDKILG